MPVSLSRIPIALRVLVAAALIFFIWTKGLLSFPVILIVAIVLFYIFRSRTTAPNSKMPADTNSATSKADYEFRNPLGGFYIGIHLAEQLLVLKGAARKRLKCDFNEAIRFADVRGARAFQDTNTWTVNAQGIEVEINNLDTPVIRVTMPLKEQKVWMARLAQVCNMRRY